MSNRRVIVSRAKCEIEQAILTLEESHGLTEAEALMILTDMLSWRLHSIVKDERDGEEGIPDAGSPAKG